jgi:outer membrane protein assembly factor BamB
MKPADLYMEDLFDFFLSSPVIGDQGSSPLLYFGSSDGNLYALDAKTGLLKWKFKPMASFITAGLLSGNSFFRQLGYISLCS